MLSCKLGEKKKKLKINPVSVCRLIEPLFARNILCLSGFRGEADEKRPRTGERTMRSVPTPPGAGRSSGSRAGQRERSLKDLTPATKTGGQVTRGQGEVLCHVKRPARLCPGNHEILEGTGALGSGAQ